MKYITKILSDSENLEQIANQCSVPTNSLTHSHHRVIQNNKSRCISDNPLVKTSALIVHIKVTIDNAEVTIPSSINHKSFQTWSCHVKTPSLNVRPSGLPTGLQQAKKDFDWLSFACLANHNTQLPGTRQRGAQMVCL